MALIDRFRRLATRDHGGRDQGTRNQGTSDQTARDQVARDQVVRDQTLRDHATVGAFIDDQSFALAKSCADDYARLRAGEGADALLADVRFAAALDKACWEGYPRALTMAGAVVEGLLRPQAGDNASAVQSGLIAIMLENFDRRPVPPAIGSVDWSAARADIERSLGDLARAQPKSVDALVRDQSSFYLAIMPLHAKLGTDDFPALRSQLNLSLAKFQAAFRQRADLAALTVELATRVPKVEAGDAPSAPP